MGEGIVGLGGPLGDPAATTCAPALVATVVVVAVGCVACARLGRRTAAAAAGASTTPEPAARRFVRLAFGGAVDRGRAAAGPAADAGRVRRRPTSSPHVPDQPGWLRSLTEVRHPGLGPASGRRRRVGRVWLEIGLGVWLLVGRARARAGPPAVAWLAIVASVPSGWSVRASAG